MCSTYTNIIYVFVFCLFNLRILFVVFTNQHNPDILFIFNIVGLRSCINIKQIQTTIITVVDRFVASFNN